MTQTADPAGRRQLNGNGAESGEMTLIEHLQELRSRLFKAALAIAAAFAIGFAFRAQIFDVLIQPYCDLPQELRGASGVFDADRCALIVTDVLGAFFVTLKASAVVAVALAAPAVAYQVWRFVTPGLRPNERRYALPFLTLTFLLFVGGAVFAYFVIPRGLQFLVGFAGDAVVPLLDANNYMSFILKTMLGFGLSFEAPLIIGMLTIADLVTYQSLRRFRRHAIFAAFALAAIITPTQDPFTMVVMAGPLVLFYEGNVLLARVLERRRRS